MARIARHVRVTGSVQGVFFRAWVQEKARELGIDGWVRNHPDGSVEARLEGEEGAVRWLIDIMGDGPSSAGVEKVRAEEVPIEGLTGFEVRH